MSIIITLLLAGGCLLAGFIVGYFVGKYVEINKFNLGK